MPRYRSDEIASPALKIAPLTQSFITHQQSPSGDTSKFVMGPKPKMNLGQSWGFASASGPADELRLCSHAARLQTGQRELATSNSRVDRFGRGNASWLPDFTFDAGSFKAKNMPIDVSASGAASLEIYQAERYDSYGSDITCKYPVPKGAIYTVRLHFAEILSPQPGARLENISLNGVVVLPKFDIAREVG